MQCKAIFKATILTVIGLFLTHVQASELEIPNTFEDGQATSAAEMNANFEAIKAAVNDNNNRINAPRSQFVGFSSTKLDGAGGMFAMQQACHVSFVNSHVCDTSEVSGSSYSVSAMATVEEEDSAWIRTKVAGFNSERTIINEDASAQASYTSGQVIYKTTCAGWGTNNASYRGFTINGTNGRIGNQACNLSAKVACCR